MSSVIKRSLARATTWAMVLEREGKHKRVWPEVKSTRLAQYATNNPWVDQWPLCNAPKGSGGCVLSRNLVFRRNLVFSHDDVDRNLVGQSCRFGCSPPAETVGEREGGSPTLIGGPEDRRPAINAARRFDHLNGEALPGQPRGHSIGRPLPCGGVEDLNPSPVELGPDVSCEAGPAAV